MRFPYLRNSRGIILGTLLASLCAVFLHSRVYLDFERVRVSIVQEEQTPSDGSILVPLPDLSDLRGQSTAIIVRLNNRQTEPLSVTVLVDDTQVGRLVVGPERVARVDGSVADGAVLARGAALEMSGSD